MSFAANERTSSIRPHRLAHVLHEGLRFGKYRVVRLIALGGMSEVYEAQHVALQKRVALKVMRPDLAESLEARNRFEAEGIHAARIQHTNVVDVTDVGEVDELPYLVMTLLEGEDLGAVFDRQGRIAPCEIVDLLLPVASAVAFGHALGVVHRDLKPDNIFLHREGCRVVPKVLDFGVSRCMGARRSTLSSSVFGTPHYMSPEQARGAPTDAQSDQYSLAVILYEALTGRLPRDSANVIELLHSVAYGSFQPPSELCQLPAEFESVILRAMARDPNGRFPSMRDFARALVPFASQAAQEYWSVELDAAAFEGPEPLPQPARHSTPPTTALVHGSRELLAQNPQTLTSPAPEPHDFDFGHATRPSSVTVRDRIDDALPDLRSRGRPRSVAGHARGTRTARVVLATAALLGASGVGYWAGQHDPARPGSSRGQVTAARSAD